MQPFTLTSMVTPSTLRVCPSSADHSTTTGTREFTRTTERTCSSFAAIPKLLVFTLSTGFSDLCPGPPGPDTLTPCVFKTKSRPRRGQWAASPYLPYQLTQRGAIRSHPFALLLALPP